MRLYRVPRRRQTGPRFDVFDYHTRAPLATGTRTEALHGASIALGNGHTDVIISRQPLTRSPRPTKMAASGKQEQWWERS